MQNDMISRSAAKDEILSWAVCLNKPHLLSRDDTMCVLDTLPAVDAVEVIRCWECKYSELEFFADNGTIRIEHYKCTNNRICINVLDRDDFCSYGERRVDDDK
jgi:hypothetical protein